MDIQKLLQQAQGMQSRLQAEMERLEVEAASGGGMVRVRMNGKKEILHLTIDPEVVREDDLPMLQDLVIAAVNQASRNVDQAMTSRMGSLAGGLNLGDLG